MSIIDIIKSSKLVEIHCIIEGMAASAASLIAICCHKRYIHRNSNILIHQLRAGSYGKLCDLDDEHSNIQEWHKKMVKLYKDHTRLSEKEIMKHLSNEIEWDSKTSLKRVGR